MSIFRQQFSVTQLIKGVIGLLVVRNLFLFVLAVLRRIKVTFIDTIIRIEHQPLDLQTDVALEVHVKR